MARKIMILVIITIISAAAFSMTYYFSLNIASGKRQLVVFCAGSLYIPLEELAAKYGQQHANVEVVIEPSGSVMAVRKVTELGRRCDVLAVADYRLIPKMMFTEHADWCIAFASNEVVLTYTNSSRYADLINSDNWIEVLLKPDVKYGFSNPNDDPCGYRAVTILGLASIYYGGPEVFEELVTEVTNIYAEEVNETLHIYVPADLEVGGSRLVVRSKSVDLIALLEAGSLDYAFEYRSVAVQHNLSFVELPPELSLGSPEHTDFYAKAAIHIMCGTEQEKMIEGAPIVYGVTIPSFAENRGDAAEFVKMLISSVGEEVFEGLGQSFLEDPIYIGEVPEELKV